jgi:hypothetical protein
VKPTRIPKGDVDATECFLRFCASHRAACTRAVSLNGGGGWAVLQFEAVVVVIVVAAVGRWRADREVKVEASLSQ